MNFDPRDYDSRDDDRHTSGAGRGGRNRSDERDREHDRSSSRLHRHDRHEHEARTLGRGPGNERQGSEDRCRDRSSDPRWDARDRDARERDREPATHSRGISTCRVGSSESWFVTAIASTYSAARNRARWRPSAPFEWSPVVTFETTTIGQRIRVPVNRGKWAQTGQSESFGSRESGIDRRGYAPSSAGTRGSAKRGGRSNSPVS